MAKNTNVTEVKHYGPLQAKGLTEPKCSEALQLLALQNPAHTKFHVAVFERAQDAPFGKYRYAIHIEPESKHILRLHCGGGEGDKPAAAEFLKKLSALMPTDAFREPNQGEDIPLVIWVNSLKTIKDAVNKMARNQPTPEETRAVLNQLMEINKSPD